MFVELKTAILTFHENLKSRSDIGVNNFESKDSLMKNKEHHTIRPACVFCCLPTDQDVVQVDCHSGKVTCELVHDILEVPGSGTDSKWKPHMCVLRARRLWLSGPSSIWL